MNKKNSDFFTFFKILLRNTRATYCVREIVSEFPGDDNGRIETNLIQHFDPTQKYLHRNGKTAEGSKNERNVEEDRR